MLKEKESSSDRVLGGGEGSQTKLTPRPSGEYPDNPDAKIGSSKKGVDFMRISEMVCDESQSNPFKPGNSVSQELTLSYLCDSSKLNLVNTEANWKSLLNSFEKANYEGKEVVFDDQKQEDNRCIERDFLQLNEKKGNSSKRAEDEETEEGTREKKRRLETLDLSLALPDISLYLTATNPPQNSDFPSRLRSSRSVQALEPSNNNIQTTYSNDFTAASLSYSYSHPFSHNPSCSLTRNSNENYEYSVGSHRRDCDQIWNCGEGTNGSVHSQFRPIRDGFALSNHGGGSFRMMKGDHQINKDSCNSLYRATSSDNNSLFPSELSARPKLDAQSGDSREKGSEHLKGVESFDRGRARKLSRPERILQEIVSESVPLMAQIIQEVPDEAVESTKVYVKSLITTPDRREELMALHNRLERRSDLSKETLSKSHRSQLEILVAIKMGLGSILSSKLRLPTNELVEIFLLERCRNVNCKRLLPVDDCDCKICSTKKGFCSECMCPVCSNFDCANNTCSWVGCDVCSHWCHAACGIQRNLIKPGPSLKGASGTTEMQFHCLGCGHASEMFGFVKDVFMACAKDWSLEALMKELDCVRKIFKGSEDVKGKELHVKTSEMLGKLENKMMSSSDVCSFIFQFFKCTEGLSDFTASSVLPKDFTASQSSLRKDVYRRSPTNSLSKSSFYNMSSSSGRHDLPPADFHQNNVKASPMSDKIVEDEWYVKLSRKDGFDSLESIVRVKEAEAKMFQNKADEARREADQYRQISRIKNEKVEEYTEKLAKLRLQETEERQRKNWEELKILENSQYDYCKMKMRMQSEIAGLLERMEATKEQLV